MSKHFPLPPPDPARARDDAAEGLSLALFRLADRVGQVTADFLAEHGLTTQQFNALRILYVRRAALPVGTIAATLLTRVPDVPRLVARLEKAGLVRREKSQADARVCLVHLTDAGEALVERIDPGLLALHRDLYRDLAPRDLARLRSDLDDLTRLLRAADDDDDDGPAEDLASADAGCG